MLELNVIPVTVSTIIIATFATVPCCRCNTRWMYKVLKRN